MVWPSDSELAAVIFQALVKSPARYGQLDHVPLVQGELDDVTIDDHFDMLNVARLVREHMQKEEKADREKAMRNWPPAPE